MTLRLLKLKRKLNTTFANNLGGWCIIHLTNLFFFSLRGEVEAKRWLLIHRAKWTEERRKFCYYNVSPSPLL